MKFSIYTVTYTDSKNVKQMVFRKDGEPDTAKVSLEDVKAKNPDARTLVRIAVNGPFIIG